MDVSSFLEWCTALILIIDGYLIWHLDKRVEKLEVKHLDKTLTQRMLVNEVDRLQNENAELTRQLKEAE